MVTDLNRTDMFLGYDWLVKHNLEVNWKNGTIKFKKCPESYTMRHQQLKVGLIVESKSQYIVPCFYIPKKDGSL